MARIAAGSIDRTDRRPAGGLAAFHGIVVGAPLLDILGPRRGFGAIGHDAGLLAGLRGKGCWLDNAGRPPGIP
jgi:hypothetical protein